MQDKDNPDKGNHGDGEQEKDGAELAPKGLPRWLFQLIGPLSLIVLVVGGIAAYYAYFYVNRDSVRAQFWVGFMFSFMALIVVTVQVVIYAQQAEFMREQGNMMAESNKLARDALYLSERPYVVVYDVQITNLPFEAAKLITYEATTENKGKTPAYDIEFRMYIDIEPHLLPKEPDYRGVRTTDSRTAMGINVPMKGKQTDINDILSDDQIEAIKSGDLSVYIWGIVRYRDGLANNAHHTTFYLVYDPDEGRFTRGGYHNDMT